MRTANDRSDHLDERRRQARAWFVIREPPQGWSAAQQKEWETWAADARNLAEYREYEKVDRLLRTLPRQPLPTDDELHGKPGGQGSGAGYRAAGSRLVHAVAIFAVVITMGLLFGPHISSMLQPTQPQVFQTAPGQQRTVTLQDQSVVQMGGATRLAILLSGETRRVTLYEGEAMLKVTSSSQRPFQVDIEGTRVTVLGTTFHVRRYNDRRVIVEVAEGTVAVTPRERDVHPVRVKAGQEVGTDPTGRITPVHMADFQAITGWLYGRRIYREKPLREVIEDLQLYLPRRIEYNRALDSLSFNGIIDPSKPEESIRGLEEVFPIVVDDSDSRRVVIRCRQPDCR